jgi:exopolysaccharide biosynthesis polyprenyl glycosylphosphotransferase
MILGRRPAYKYFLALMDYIIVNFSFALAMRLRFRPRIDIINLNNLEVIPEIIVFALLSILWIWILQYHNLYKFKVFLSVARQQVLLLRSLAYSTVVMVLLQYFLKPSGKVESRLVFLLTFLFSLVLLSIWRLVIFRKFYRLFARNKLLRRSSVIVGFGEQAKKIATSIMADKEIGKQLIGFIDNQVPVGTRIFGNFFNIGTTSELPEIARDYQIDEVIIASEQLSHEEMLELIDLCRTIKIPVQVSAPLYSVISDRTQVEMFNDIPAVQFSNPQVAPWYRVYKRAFDLLGSLSGILLFFPFWVLIVLLIRLDSRGSALFKQQRIGLGGKPFNFYKFRSMRRDTSDAAHRKFVQEYMASSDTDDHKTQKIQNDPRITRIGVFLRRYSLDELPQFLNVVRGDMSLVGPRPCLPWEWEEYEPWQKRRLSVKPGCTGLWQVSGRSEVGFKDMVVLDLYYADHASPWFDLQLILKTIPVMLFGRGGH